MYLRMWRLSSESWRLFLPSQDLQWELCATWTESSAGVCQARSAWPNGTGALLATTLPDQHAAPPFAPALVRQPQPWQISAQVRWGPSNPAQLSSSPPKQKETLCYNCWNRKVPTACLTPWCPCPMLFECVPEIDSPWPQESPGVDFQMRKEKKKTTQDYTVAPVWPGSKGPDGDWVTDSLGIGSHCGERQNLKLKDGARKEMVIGKITA